MYMDVFIVPFFLYTYTYLISVGNLWPWDVWTCFLGRTSVMLVNTLSLACRWRHVDDCLLLVRSNGVKHPISIHRMCPTCLLEKWLFLRIWAFRKRYWQPSSSIYSSTDGLWGLPDGLFDKSLTVSIQPWGQRQLPLSNTIGSKKSQRGS